MPGTNSCDHPTMSNARKLPPAKNHVENGELTGGRPFSEYQPGGFEVMLICSGGRKEQGTQAAIRSSARVLFINDLQACVDGGMAFREVPVMVADQARQMQEDCPLFVVHGSDPSLPLPNVKSGAAKPAPTASRRSRP